MEKRRAEDPLLLDSPSKRCCSRSLRGVDMPLDSVAPTSGRVMPPSLLALLGTRCRKRPYSSGEKQEEEAAAAAALCDTMKQATSVLTVHTSGSFQECRSASSALTNTKKRPRKDSEGSDTVIHKAAGKADGDTNTEDCSYNSFQYWRVPLPELDLSLLEDASDNSQTKEKSKVKDTFFDAMET